MMPTINIARAVTKRTGDTIATAMRAGMQPKTYFTLPCASTAVEVRESVGEGIERRFMLNIMLKLYSLWACLGMSEETRTSLFRCRRVGRRNPTRGWPRHLLWALPLFGC